MADELILPEWEASTFIRDRVCARCYGDLRQYPAPDRAYFIRCLECGDAWGGATIARYTAEKRGQQALAEIYEVKANMPDLFPRIKMSEADIIKSLGY